MVRRIGTPILWGLLVVFVAVGINLLGIEMLGDLHRWHQWLQSHAGYFMTWRLCLYGVTAYGWHRTRHRLLGLSDTAGANRRLVRAEIAAVLTIAVLEASAYVQLEQ
jgi:hypothetical protein